MSQETKRTIALSIVVGIIVFILCYIFIQPFLNFITPKFLLFCSRFISFCSDQIYQQAAVMDYNRFDVTIFGFFVGALSSFFMFPFIFLIRNKMRKVGHREITNKLFNRNDFIFSIAGLFVIFSLMLFTYSDYFLNIRFERKMRILSPLLSDQQEEDVYAKWSMMQNRVDFVVINNYLNSCAKQNKISHPASLWNKPF